MLNQTGLLSGLEGIRSGPLPEQRTGVCPEEVNFDFTALTTRDHPRATVVSRAMSGQGWNPPRVPGGDPAAVPDKQGGHSMVLLLFLASLALWVVVLRRARSRPDHRRTWFVWLVALPVIPLIIPGGLTIMWAVLAVYWFRHARHPPTDEPEQNPIG